MKCLTAEEGKEILKLMKAHVETTQPHVPWSVKSSDQDFTSQQHYQMQKHSSDGVKDANTSPNRITYLLTT